MCCDQKNALHGGERFLFRFSLCFLASGVGFAGHLFQGAERAGGDADAFAVDLDSLQIYPLTTSGGDV